MAYPSLPIPLLIETVRFGCRLVVITEGPETRKEGAERSSIICIRCPAYFLRKRYRFCSKPFGPDVGKKNNPRGEAKKTVPPGGALGAPKPPMLRPRFGKEIHCRSTSARSTSMWGSTYGLSGSTSCNCNVDTRLREILKPNTVDLKPSALGQGEAKKTDIVL